MDLAWDGTPPRAPVPQAGRKYTGRGRNMQRTVIVTPITLGVCLGLRTIPAWAYIHLNSINLHGVLANGLTVNCFNSNGLGPNGLANGLAAPPDAEQSDLPWQQLSSRPSASAKTLARPHRAPGAARQEPPCPTPSAHVYAYAPSVAACSCSALGRLGHVRSPGVYA